MIYILNDDTNVPYVVNTIGWIFETNLEPINQIQSEVLKLFEPKNKITFFRTFLTSVNYSPLYYLILEGPP